MIRDVIILGTVGNCIDILDTIHAINRREPAFRCRGFLDDNPATHGRQILDAPVLGPLDSAPQYGDAFFVNGIGSPANFWKKGAIIGRTQIPRERFVTLIHPTASVSAHATLGAGTVVFQHVTITTNVRIGDHVIILPASIISHDSVVGDYTAVAGGVCVSGQVTIGESCYLGAGSVIRDGIRIGRQTLVGMGAVVIRDVPENTVVAGNPARVLRSLT
jgi:sugar O-acyltransferase (sialic acid O-acetyltransferase NeuD family)